MTLNQALKTKNRLAGELNRLKEILRRENARISTNTSKVDREEVGKAVFAIMDQLVALKTKISAANVGIYEKIEQSKELKGMIEFLKSVPTTDGVVESSGYNGTTARHVYDAHYKQEQIDNMVRGLQTKIEQLQDEIDAYNAVTQI